MLRRDLMRALHCGRTALRMAIEAGCPYSDAPCRPALAECNDERRGVASAYGSSATTMSCEYQTSSPRQGAGMCTLSNGAKYQVHVGS